mmetsp:Transcript_28666/g.58592  ORF Transcript_28666/g.58592 Transcript_28666/m.58592 type:complete len:144 (-) Transcript_28666:385-816(-)
MDDVLAAFSGLSPSVQSDSSSSSSGLSISANEAEALLRSLNFVVEPEKLDNAIQILDDRRLRILITAAGRTCYDVQGSNKSDRYFCIVGYCSCKCFFQLAMKTAGPVMCKHLLAVRLAPFLQKPEVLDVTDHELAKFMMQINS